jgi:uncharacterized repeat protein (TIGR03803 family)
MSFCVVLESGLPGMVRDAPLPNHHSSEIGRWRLNPALRIHHAQVEVQWAPLSCSSFTTSVSPETAACISAVSPPRFSPAANVSLFSDSTGEGTVFKLTPGSSGWTNTVLQNFKGSDGKFAYAGLLADKSGNLYGTTSSSLNGLGAVFELTPAAGGWIYNVIYRFPHQTNGSFPLAGLIFDAAGNLYGTTTYGGANNGGTVFEILP